MTLAYKLGRLREKRGWTQEGLAERLHTSPQDIDAWETSQREPSLAQVVQLSRLLGTSTDYLLKDELDDDGLPASVAAARTVSKETAHRYLVFRRRSAFGIATAAFLCITCCVPMMLLIGFSRTSPGLSEAMAIVLGLLTLLLLAAVSAGILLGCGLRGSRYNFLTRELFELDNEARCMVLEAQDDFRSAYVRCNIFGTCTCVISPAPLVAASFFSSDLLAVCVLSLYLLLVGSGVAAFIFAGVRWESIQRLLRNGSPAGETRAGKLRRAVSLFYWLIVLIIFLTWGFAANTWSGSWTIWPIAGMLFPGVLALCNLRRSES